jgi:hypothetical protein
MVAGAKNAAILEIKHLDDGNIRTDQLTKNLGAIGHTVTSSSGKNKKISGLIGIISTRAVAIRFAKKALTEITKRYGERALTDWIQNEKIRVLYLLSPTDSPQIGVGGELLEGQAGEAALQELNLMDVYRIM